LATYARTEAVRGVLVSNAPIEKIVAPAPGTVKALLVAEGSKVTAGDRIAVVDADVATTDDQGVGAAQIGANKRILELESRQATLTRIAGEERVRQLMNKIRTDERRLGNLKQERSAQQDVATSNEKMLQRIEQAVAKGFISEVEHERRKQVWRNSLISLTQVDQQIASLEGEIVDTRFEIKSSEREVSQSLLAGSRRQEEVGSQTVRVSGQASYVVRARITGRVYNLQTEVGRSVSASLPLMVIVPDDLSLGARLLVPTRAVGFLHPSQRTNLLLDSFPYQKFGGVAGVILSVSKAPMDPKDIEAPFRIEEPMYSVRVKLDRQYMSAFGQKQPLLPGMTLIGNITLERQSFLEWILMPLRSVWQRNKNAD